MERITRTLPENALYRDQSVEEFQYIEDVIASLVPYFEPMAQAVQKENYMLHPTVEDMIQSLMEGNGVFSFSETMGHVVGYARLTESLTPELADKLGMGHLGITARELSTACVMNGGTYSIHLPEGTVATEIIPHQFRGHGIMTELIQDLLRIAKDHNPREIVFGTTKSPYFLAAFASACEKSGVPYTMGNHGYSEPLRDLTCFCSGDFGSGRQHGLQCPARTRTEGTLTREDVKGMIAHMQETGEDIHECFMFSTDPQLAKMLELAVNFHYSANGLSSSDNLVDKLNELQHYG